VTATSHEPDELLLGFARALRAAGVNVTLDRAQSYLRAAAVVGVDDRAKTYVAGRATLCAGPDDLRTYDRVFAAWFGERPEPGSPPDRPRVTVVQASLGEGDGDGEQEDQATVIRAAASDVEVLRHRDIADLSAEERAAFAALFGALHPTAPQRVAYRRTGFRRGEVDTRATLRRTLKQMGEPVEIAWQRRSSRARRVVLLVDISGSMSPYADALLRLSHRFAHSIGPVEVFTVGTRVTRVTRAMRARDADAAIVAAGEAVPDWSGGTRLGETLKAFLDRWGQRGVARGAVVVIFSDGWERGDATLLGDQMQRLHRLAHRVVWVNPHKGNADYEPVQQGMAAALPHVDDLVAGHSFAAFADLTRLVGRA